MTGEEEPPDSEPEPDRSGHQICTVAALPKAPSPPANLAVLKVGGQIRTGRIVRTLVMPVRLMLLSACRSLAMTVDKTPPGTTAICGLRLAPTAEARRLR